MRTWYRRRQPNYSADNGFSDPPAQGDPARGTWDHAFAGAKRYYEGAHAPDPDVLASNTAWKTIGLLRNPAQVGTLRGRSVPFGIPSHRVELPPKATLLGRVLEICFIAMDGSLICQKFAEPGLPDLIWDNVRKELFMLPNSSRASSCLPLKHGFEKQSEMHRVWSKRDADCAIEYRDPNAMVVPVGIADTVAYRSDKWDKKSQDRDLQGSSEYVHQFDDGVFVEQNRRRGNEPPKVALIHGGKLDVEADGIIH